MIGLALQLVFGTIATIRGWKWIPAALFFGVILLALLVGVTNEATLILFLTLDWVLVAIFAYMALNKREVQ